MADSKIIFDPSVPAEILPIVQRFVLPCEWLIPAWCTRVYIAWDSMPEDQSAANTISHYDYRFARTVLFPVWLEEKDERKTEVVLHEFLHISIAPLSDYAYHNLKVLLEEDEPKFYKHAKAELEQRMEAVVEDLTISLRHAKSGP